MVWAFVSTRLVRCLKRERYLLILHMRRGRIAMSRSGAWSNANAAKLRQASKRRAVQRVFLDEGIASSTIPLVKYPLVAIF